MLVVCAALEQATYVDTLFSALSKDSVRSLSVTLTETELAGIDDLVGKRQPPQAIDVAGVQERLGALISTITGCAAKRKSFAAKELRGA